MRIQDYKLYEEANVVADAQTSAIDMEHQIGISVQVDWAATTASAVLTLQASNDGNTWHNLGSTVTINNNSGTSMLYATDFHYKFARVDINHNSGTITNLKLHVLSKGL